ncbi:hypothetical protein QQ020_16745 [Fulvivirgaceae bacterium BMA12]|uniref:Transposase n=1 Tax=Agaribacillus aureus TaxID=3051825 RepID=A0ABT8LBQ7_9BACT|nr:hypothetical protein [Fulvivirgaceae bacterium BMA12]
MGKITLKYYLDRRLKSKQASKDEVFLKAADGYYYPLYVQVICKRQNTKFRSFIKPPRKSTDFGVYEIGRDLGDTDNKKLRGLIEQEKKSIRTVVLLLRPFENEKFSLAGFSSVYKRSVVEMSFLVSNHCKQALKKVMAGSKFKAMTEIIDWQLTYVVIKSGLNGMLRFIARRNKQKFLNQVEEIDKIFTAFGDYAGKKTITLSQWIAEDHGQKIKNFLIRHKYREYDKISAGIQAVVHQHNLDFK